jgi:hypothetical protein
LCCTELERKTRQLAKCMIRYIWRHGGRERILHFYITGDTHGNFDRIEEARKEVREK